MDYNIYWGDIHSHAYCGRQFSTPKRDLAIAKGHLDFWAPTEHAFGKKGDEELWPGYWKELRPLLIENNRPGKFVTILGYEWADVVDWVAGDMNVYFPGEAMEDPPLPRTYSEMVPFVREQNAILIPHHVGYTTPYPGTDWGRFLTDIMPAVEVFSMHGSSERDDGPFPMNLVCNGPRATGSTVIEGLERGLMFGIIGGTDEHVGYPGAYRMGLMAAYAPDLTREAIWDALLSRRVYAVTGDRIKVEFSINGSMMGAEIRGQPRREIAVHVVGEDTLNEVDVIKNGRLWKRETRAFGKNAPGDRAVVRIEWGWGNYDWDGEVEIAGGRIGEAVPHFGPPGPNEITHQDETRCRWKSHTGIPEPTGHFGHTQYVANTGGNYTNQIAIGVEPDKHTKLHLRMNGKQWAFTLADLLANSYVLVQEHSPSNPFGDRCPLSARKIKIHRAIARSLYEAEYRFIDNESERDVDYYYLRVTQSNGQMAWSSPIWVSR